MCSFGYVRGDRFGLLRVVSVIRVILRPTVLLSETRAVKTLDLYVPGNGFRFPQKQLHGTSCERLAVESLLFYFLDLLVCFCHVLILSPKKILN